MIRLGRLWLCAGPVSRNGWAALALVWWQGRDGHNRVPSVGFGWDDEYPIRLWPRWGWGTTDVGYPLWTLSWCGLFVSWVVGASAAKETA